MGGKPRDIGGLPYILDGVGRVPSVSRWSLTSDEDRSSKRGGEDWALTLGCTTDAI